MEPVRPTEDTLFLACPRPAIIAGRHHGGDDIQRHVLLHPVSRGGQHPLRPGGDSDPRSLSHHLPARCQLVPDPSGVD